MVLLRDAGSTTSIVPLHLFVVNFRCSSHFQLLTERLGNDVWVTSLDELARLRDMADDPALQYAFSQTKLAAKVTLSYSMPG